MLTPLFGEGELRDRLLGGLETALKGVASPNVVFDCTSLDKINYIAIAEIAKSDGLSKQTTTRISNILSQIGIKTYLDLANFYKSEVKINSPFNFDLLFGRLSRFHGIGTKSLNVLGKHLKSIGFNADNYSAS